MKKVPSQVSSHVKRSRLGTTWANLPPNVALARTTLGPHCWPGGPRKYANGNYGFVYHLDILARSQWISGVPAAAAEKNAQGRGRVSSSRNAPSRRARRIQNVLT